MIYPVLPNDFSPQTRDQDRRVVSIVNGIMNGKTNNTGTVTLTANQATTDVTESKGRLSAISTILFMPTTANAAAEIPTMYVSDIDSDAATFEITHANNAQTDRRFYYAIIG